MAFPRSRRTEKLWRGPIRTKRAKRRYTARTGTTGLRGKAWDFHSVLRKAPTQAWINFLASEHFEGRMTGSPKEAEYVRALADNFARMGFKPEIQTYEFTSGIELLGANALTLNIDGVDQKPVVGADWIPDLREGRKVSAELGDLCRLRNRRDRAERTGGLRFLSRPRCKRQMGRRFCGSARRYRQRTTLSFASLLATATQGHDGARARCTGADRHRGRKNAIARAEFRVPRAAPKTSAFPCFGCPPRLADQLFKSAGHRARNGRRNSRLAKSHRPRFQNFARSHGRSEIQKEQGAEPHRAEERSGPRLRP